MSYRGHILPWVLTAITVPAVATDLPDRADYAYRFLLDTPGDAEFYSAELPQAVYQSISDPLLRDAGVYNAAGQPVPRLFEHPDTGVEGREQRVSLGLVPLYGEVAEASEQLRLLLQSDAGVTRLELNKHSESPREGGPRLSAYIIDARSLEQRLEALELEWSQKEQGLIAAVTVQHSDDLQHWRVLGSGSLADIEYEGTRIEQRRIPVAAAAADFLRITWGGMPDSWRLEKVTGILQVGDPPTSRDWLVAERHGPGEADREFLFDAGGFPPVDRVDLDLPDRNTAVRVSIFYRLGEDDRWRLAHNGVFYSLAREGVTLRSDPAPIETGRASQWKVRIDAGASSAPPGLRLGWRPDRLVFVAQGGSPFELVAGRAMDRLEGFPQQAQMADAEIFRILRESARAGEAHLGSREAILGERQLSLRDGFSWKTVLLWLGLTAAIALVGGIALSLLREGKSG